MLRGPTLCIALRLLVALGVVHVTVPTTPFLARAKAAAPKPVDTLPAGVTEMREAILDAVRSGRLDDLKLAVDLNELKPELGPTLVADPITFWRGLSADGTGRDILASVGVLLEGPYAVVPLGKDAENTRLFVWPKFADVPFADLSADDVAVLALVEPPAKITAMKAAGRYTGWRIVIGADGVWHIFRRYD